MIVRTIRTGDICRMFHRIDGRSHDTGGDGFGYEHSGPRASSLYTALFLSQASLRQVDIAGNRRNGIGNLEYMYCANSENDRPHS